jgi:hypothetical protein
MPAAVERRQMSPDCERLTLRAERRTHSIIDSRGFVDSSVFFRLPPMSRRVRVRVPPSLPAAKRRRRGGGVLEIAAQDAELVERPAQIGLGPRAAQPALDGGAVALEQVVEHAALLVSDSSLHPALAEHRPDRVPERPGAVDHEQDALLGIEVALGKVR